MPILPPETLTPFVTVVGSNSYLSINQLNEITSCIHITGPTAMVQTVRNKVFITTTIKWFDEKGVLWFLEYNIDSPNDAQAYQGGLYYEELFGLSDDEEGI